MSTVLLSSPMITYPLHSLCPYSTSETPVLARRNGRHFQKIVSSQTCTHETIKLVDTSTLQVAESFSEDELWAAAASLRVSSFYLFQPSFGIEDHEQYLAEREFEALKERVAG